MATQHTWSRLRPLMIAPVLLLVLCCEALCASSPPKRAQLGVKLVIARIEPGQIVTDHEWGFVPVEVGMEAQRLPALRKQPGTPRNRISVKVDNREVSYRLLDSRTSYQGKKSFSYRTLGVPLGEPGSHSVTISAGGMSRKVPVVFKPAGRIEIADLFDGQAVFGKKEIAMRWVGAYILPGSVRAKVNGEEVPLTVIRTDERLHLVEGRLGPVTNGVTGTNTVAIEAVDLQGNRRERRIAFRHYPDNTVIVGDSFCLVLGTEEAGGGPFFEANVEGMSLMGGERTGVRLAPERLGGEIVLPAGRTVLARFTAALPGESMVKVKERQYRTDPFLEKENLRIVVRDPSQVPVAAEVKRAGGYIMKRFYAPDLFTCELPGEWVVTRNPDEARGIYGLSAIGAEKGGASGPGARVSVEFYPHDNYLGLRTAEEFVSSEASERRMDNRPVPVTVVKAAGREAKRFERGLSVAKKMFVFFAIPVRLVERFMVLPAEGGFYVLRATMPQESIRETGELFEAVIESFEPLK